MNLLELQLVNDKQRETLHKFASSMAHEGCNFLEVGSWCGDSSTILAGVAKEHNGKLFCVDTWGGSAGTALENVAQNADVFNAFWANMKNHGLQDTVVPIRCASDIAITILAAETMDMVFIDGDHRYDQAYKDLKNYGKLVKDGGIYCGHDCEDFATNQDIAFLEAHKNKDFIAGRHCGIILAMDELYRGHYTIENSIWRMNKFNGEFKQ